METEEPEAEQRLLDVSEQAYTEIDLSAVLEESDVTAVYIHIEGDPVERAKAMPARSYREVVINYNGKEIEMTFDEFLQRVGLAE